METKKIRTAKINSINCAGQKCEINPKMLSVPEADLKQIFDQKKDVDKVVELVNHPSHYKGNKFEAIDIIEDFNLNFNLGNAIKYILRAGKKNEVEDQRD